MIKKTSILLAAILGLLTYTETRAAGDETTEKGIDLTARIGWSVGATAPMGMPATIRSIEKFRLTPSFLVGVDVHKFLGHKWGIQAGVHFENKAMDGDVTTKAYRMELVQGNSKLSGLFTGKVHQEVTQWMFTIPIQATYSPISCLRIKAGPYFSFLTGRDFNGIASDGYLRENDPTGMKILMGDKEGTWATYDFSDSMRRFQVGIGAGLDWQFYRGLGVGFDLNWGLNGIFKKDFKTVEQTLYPIYGTFSVFYRLK